MRKIIFGIFIFFLVLFQQFFLPFISSFNFYLLFLLFFTLHFLENKKNFICISIFEGGILLDFFSSISLGSHLFSLLIINLFLERILKKINKGHIFWFSLFFFSFLFSYLLLINLFDVFFSFSLSFIFSLSWKSLMANFLIALILFFFIIRTYERNFY